MYCEGCLRSLAFPEMNHRRQDIQRPHAKTCAWITRHPLYITWLKEGSGILWIKGRPGSGKSTLMEFLLREFEKQALYQESIQLSFFLHGQGTILQKSRLGMYRSLLHQLLLSAPTAQAEFRHAFQERSTSQGDPGKDWSWHTNELRAFFITAIEHVTKTRPVNIFVDALDEANDGPDDQNSMHQIVSDFHEISDLLRRKELQCTICFSCRHFPMVAGNQGRDIYIENENLADISVYVCDELHRRLSMTEIEKQYLLELQDTIVEGSQGVFQWAVVAVPLAVRCYYEGSLPSEIRQVLAGVPRGLWDVYEHILGEVIDKRYYQQTLRLMRCVSLSERPLTVTEVCFAMSLQDSEIFDSESAFAELEIPTHNVMVRRIISLSGGLIEAKQHEKGQILQFIHPSVKDFLVRDGLGFLDMTSRSKAIGQGHHQLSLICANYIRIAKIDNLDKSDAQSVKAQLPFVDYATKYWFLHAEKAEIRGLPQDYLIRYSQYYPRILEHWVRFYTILDYYNYSGRRPEKSSTILHIASSASLLSVVEGLLSTHPDLEQMDSSGNRALHYACRWGHTKLVKVLLDAGAMVEAENSSKCTALERAAANGHEEVVELLVEKRAEINKQTGYTGNALYGAAAKGSTTIVRRLLDHKANANAQGGQYGNALQAAACEGHQAVVQLLLDSGAEVNAQGGQYGNALQGAAYRGDQAIVQLLLDNKADINAQGGQYGNALQAAASKGYQAIVQLLLDNKADINAQGGEYGNALQAAASKGYQAIVELLLGDETSLSDSSEAISVASDASAIFSTVASLSSKSSISSIIHEAIEQFARIIIGEEDLKDKYEIAVSRCTEERFLRNHKRLLKRYFLDLTAEVETDVQRHAVRALRGSLQRAQVSSKVYASFSQRNVAERERMRALSAQDIDRTENLKTYLQSLPGHSEGGVETHGEIALNTKDQDDARSQSSSSGSENEDPVKESEALSLNELKKIVGFLIRGSSFQRFKEKLHQFVYPPSTIREALATKDIRVLEKVLTKNFDRATQDEYSWLREIQAIGYSIRNIAELLFEHTNDTPWIFFEPQPTIGLKIKHGFHRPSCAHSSDQNTAGCRAHSGNQSETLDISSSIGVIETESFLRSVQESCGLAGIVPISRDRRTWRGRVNFQDDNSTSYVSYGSTGEEEVDGRSLVFCIYQALRGFCEAVSYVQDGACCCDCYTILRITTRDCLPDVVDMVRVHFELVGQLESEMQRLSLSDDIDHLQCIKCGTIAGQILSILGVPFDSGDKDVEHKAENLDGDQIGEMLHRCCLAVQFLCLSFLSYSQAHCGTIQPFFLDTPQRKVVLRGSKMGAADSWQIETQLVDLTCIGEMIQDSVVVFSASNKSNIQLDLPQGLVFDLMACPEDLIDTWGPGEFIGRMSEIGNNLLCAVVIGGGIIQAAGTEDKKFHWSRDAIHGTSDASPIEPNMKLLVGAAVRVNNNCPMDETQFCLNSEEQLENLGTFEGYWETAERQVGIQTGQYVNLAFLQTWEKIPTRTMKKTQLALPDNHLLPFLQSSWGLQFSCCTGIARRVSLCELIADVMPAFVESLLPIPRLWESLKKDHNIIQAFRHDDLQTWLGNLSDECQQLVAGIVRYILSVMAHTGVDSKGKNFTVAWVRKKNPFQCFKLSCQKKNYWTRILADSGDCATFAYVGSKCLVTSSLECRGLISMWRNESTLLETAVCRHKPNLPRTGLHSTPCILQHEDYYSMGRPDALLWVKVDRGELHANPRLLVYPSIIPTAIAIRLLSKRFSNSMQTLQRLRERQSKDGQAESVVVLSAA
jgi:ankyrin repeat protein